MDEGRSQVRKIFLEIIDNYFGVEAAMVFFHVSALGPVFWNLEAASCAPKDLRIWQQYSVQGIERRKFLASIQQKIRCFKTELNIVGNVQIIKRICF
jgi:hypothetical protein